MLARQRANQIYSRALAFGHRARYGQSESSTFHIAMTAKMRAASGMTFSFSRARQTLHTFVEIRKSG